MESIGFRNSGAVEEIGSSIQYDYAKDDFIGRGAFGIVYKAKVRKALLRFRTPSEPDFVAVKVMHVAINSAIAADQQNWMTAVQRMKQLPGLKHKHLVRYHKVSITKSSGGVTVELAMDYHKGDLASFLREAKENANLMNNWGKVIRFAEDMTQGLEFLHQKGIIHGDLKPENILLIVSQNGSEKLVIGDLDDLVQMKESATCSADISQLRGTTRYMSPEMLKKFSQQEAERPGRKTDMWSLGCIILEMAENYARVPKKQLVKDGNIVDAGSDLGNYQYACLIIDGYVPSVSDDIEDNLACIIRQCLDTSSANRLSAGELLQELPKKDVIVFFGLRDSKYLCVMIFNPLTNSVNVQEVRGAPKLKGYLWRELAVTANKIVITELIRHGDVYKVKFHLWNVDEGTWGQHEPVPSLNIILYPYTTVAAVEDKAYFFDDTGILTEMDISTGEIAPLTQPNQRPLHSPEAVAKCREQIFYATRSRLFQYDTVIKKWKNLPWQQDREYFAMAVVSGHIYIMGGMLRDATLDFPATADCIRLKLGCTTWEKIEPLLQPKWRHAACVIKDRIYICGGMNTEDENAVTIEAYDTSADAGWSTVNLPPKDNKQFAAWLAAYTYSDSWYTRATTVSVKQGIDIFPDITA
ncbi:calcium/calmodulin-dependent protein kinase type II subunit gamma-like [Paramacrobiotus metropolitanus]|uniref:calcium/calmodulin-dependent protein kinase type II subunit gamma-like n=1 Tax=Paramacrobiotus metropolitanus TaxID=2943436 RepID=UPI0024461EF4|nr:calcium/calmodulin-dependent protein kinase type II subunit gamma-like [Paramacrobiotus metropolitanus]